MTEERQNDFLPQRVIINEETSHVGIMGQTDPHFASYSIDFVMINNWKWNHVFRNSIRITHTNSTRSSVISTVQKCNTVVPNLVCYYVPDTLVEWSLSEMWVFFNKQPIEYQWQYDSSRFRTLFVRYCTLIVFHVRSHSVDFMKADQSLRRMRGKSYNIYQALKQIHRFLYSSKLLRISMLRNKKCRRG